MSETKALSGQDAVAKIRDIAKGEVAMLCTSGDARGMHARPMGTPGIDDDGTLWFMSRKDSPKNEEISRNPSVQVLYSVPGKSEYLSLLGRASVGRDQVKIDQLWNVFAKAWFPQGKEDPNISLIRFTPTEGHYWDTKHNRMVQLAAIAIGAATGRTMDDGVEGALRP